MVVSETASQLSGAMSAMLTNARSISGSLKAVLQNFDATVEAINLWAGIISTLQVNKEIMRQRTLDFGPWRRILRGPLLG